MAMLEAEPFRLLICDLKMPKMDGLQVLSIVRRKYPQLRTVVLTSGDGRTVSFARLCLWASIFFGKSQPPEQEIKMFLECLESLLGREIEKRVFAACKARVWSTSSNSNAFPRVQRCCASPTGRSQVKFGFWMANSSMPKRTTYAENPAFHRILSWRAGNFETLAAEPSRPRTIFKSYNGCCWKLRRHSMNPVTTSPAMAPDRRRCLFAAGSALPSGRSRICVGDEARRSRTAASAEPGKSRAHGDWTRASLERFRALGDRLQAGQLEQIEGLGPQRNVALAQQGETEFCVGLTNTMNPEQIRDTLKKVLALWAS